MVETLAISRLAALELRTALRSMGTGASSMEAAARRLVQHLYAGLLDTRDGARISALVRLFKTVRYGDLPPQLRARATVPAPQTIEPGTRCLTLLASAGDEPAWNARQSSVSHQAIPLTSSDIVLQSPMIAQLLIQFGLDIGAVVAPDSPLLLHNEAATYNVFHVPKALGSPYVPAQEDFVKPHGIVSVIGFGGPLTDGDMFAIVVFAKAYLGADAAELFNGVALSAKIALLSAAGMPVFER